MSTHICLILCGTMGTVCTTCLNHQELCIFPVDSILFVSCDSQNMQLLSALFSVLRGWSLWWRCSVLSEVWAGFYILFTWILVLQVLKFNKIVGNILWSVGIEIDLQFTYFKVQYMKNSWINWSLKSIFVIILFTSKMKLFYLPPKWNYFISQNFTLTFYVVRTMCILTFITSTNKCTQ